MPHKVGADARFDHQEAQRYEIFEQTVRVGDGKTLTLLTLSNSQMLEAAVMQIGPFAFGRSKIFPRELMLARGGVPLLGVFAHGWCRRSGVSRSTALNRVDSGQRSQVSVKAGI
jgi:hypothetical protein